MSMKFTRLSAAAWHLLISLVVAAVVVAVFWGVWYPDGMAIVADARELFLIVVGVDVVIGPLLTLILFAPGKKNLHLDLALIALLQIAALVYGAYVMLLTRPVFLVALTDRMQLVSANEIDPVDLLKASWPEYRRLSWSGPTLAGARDPEDPGRLAALTTSVFAGGPDLYRLPEFYVPYQGMALSLAQRARRLSTWVDSTEPAVKAALAWANGKGLAAEQISVIPIIGRGGVFALLVDSEHGQPLRVFAFKPPPVRDLHEADSGSVLLLGD
jgi:hypothetical protein